jgi:hypothetical protein
MKLLARDARIPKPLRWIAGLALLPIPGPVDEVILLLVAPILFGFYGEPMREAWRRADRPDLADGGASRPLGCEK